MLYGFTLGFSLKINSWTTVESRRMAELINRFAKYNPNEVGIMENGLSDFLICLKCREGNQLLKEDVVKCENCGNQIM